MEIDYKKGNRKIRRASKGTQFVTYVTAVKQEFLVWCQCMLFLKPNELSFEAFKDELVTKLLPIGRMRSRYNFKKHQFEQLFDSEIDLNYHIELVANRDGISTHEVANEFMGDIYTAKKVDFKKPLWFSFFFPKLDDGRSLGLICISHTIGDGVALVELMLKLMDHTQVESNKARQKESKEEKEILQEEGLLREIEDQEAPPVDIFALKPKEKRKVKSRYGPLNKTRIFMGGVFSALGSALATPDSKTPLMRKNFKVASMKKSFAFTPQVSLEIIKKIKNSIEGATVNDVLVALLNLCMIDYLSSKGMTEKQLKNKKIRAGFPINSRSKKTPILKEDNSPSNNFAFGIFKFFTSYKSRIQMVHQVKKRIDIIKLSPYPFVQLSAALTLQKILPTRAFGQLVCDFISQATAQLSNVQGPQKAVKFGGATIDDLQFGLYSIVGTYFGLISYNEKVSCCVCMDDTLGDASELAQFWLPQVNALVEEVDQLQGSISKPSNTAFSFLEKL